MGDDLHPWNLAPVSGRTEWGRGWAVEILVDDDGDGLIDEDPVDLIDNDGDGLFNEDPLDPQIDNDGDGLMGEDPVNRLDDDGDGLVDEDPHEAFDGDFDGLVDEDGPDPQVDNDGDGLLNEDGLWTDGDDDYDGRKNEDPIDGSDNDGDGLIDEDPPASSGDAPGQSTWLRPIHLTPSRNLATLVNERFLAGELGGIVGEPSNPSLVIPSEYGYRIEPADPLLSSQRSVHVQMIDGDIFTALGSERGQSVFLNLAGFFYINRLTFRPRPTLPEATVSDYFIRYGDPTTILERASALNPRKTLVRETHGQYLPTVKDLRFDPPRLMGRLDLLALTPRTVYGEVAELGLYGEGYALDGIFVSEMIDVGGAEPRTRRYSRQWDLFGSGDRLNMEAEFPELPGRPVIWGKARWRGDIVGSGGEARIQFRAGNSLDTHIYERKVGPGLTVSTDLSGLPLSAFSWVKLLDGRVEEIDLDYNLLGADLGPDRKRGWSFWSAPLQFSEGLIDESVPVDQRGGQGIQLSLPGGTRYIQFRVFFDGPVQSAARIDYIEFDYDFPLAAGGVVAEIFPVRVPLGERVDFSYFLRPRFDSGDSGTFNRIDLSVPSLQTHVTSFAYDGELWDEQGASGTAGDPLADVGVLRGSFAQAAVADSSDGSVTLMLKTPTLSADDFSFSEILEISLTTELFRGSHVFSSALWNDTQSTGSTVRQLSESGDASPDVAANTNLVSTLAIGSTISEVSLSTPVVTPNGDGANDEVVFTFSAFLLLDRAKIEIRLYDLAGHRVRNLRQTQLSAGLARLTWNGTNARDELLAPGLYIYEVLLKTDVPPEPAVGTISLVY